MTEQEPPSWFQITVEGSSLHLEKIEQILSSNQALSVTLQDAADQPILEPSPGESPVWDNCLVTGLFSNQLDSEQLLITLHNQLATIDAKPIKLDHVSNKDWQNAWMKHFKPMIFNNKLCIHPSHLPPPQTAMTNVILDPGMAFGTGTHPTTDLCLQWLAANDLSNKTIIDYGCGSGILAIAAIKLGVDKAYAIDIDPQALLAAENNALKNNIGDELLIGTPETFKAIKADIIIANILSGVLIKLNKELSNMLSPQGMLVLSGILKDQQTEVINAYCREFTFEAPMLSSDWVLLSAHQ